MMEVYDDISSQMGALLGSVSILWLESTKQREAMVYPSEVLADTSFCIVAIQTL